MGFGRYFQQLRRDLRFTLRDFCLEGNFDSGVVSRVERERSRPPQDDETLDAWAEVLGLSDSKCRELKELASEDADMPYFIPLSDEEILNALPPFPHKEDGSPLSEQEKRALVEKIRNEV